MAPAHRSASPRPRTGGRVSTTPDVASPIRAYRAWMVPPEWESHRPPKLRSMAFEDYWSREMTGRCSHQESLQNVWRMSLLRRIGRDHHVAELLEEARRYRHDAPGPECGCGLYATKTLDILRDKYDLGSRRHIVYGEVDLWGRVEEHTWGYRAQHARIVNLYANGHRLLGRLARHYNVPIVTTDGRDRSIFAPAERSKVGFYVTARREIVVHTNGREVGA